MKQRLHIPVQGSVVSYIEHGEPQPGQPSILILHGLIADAETFDALATELQPNHVIALDMPGSGPSQALADPSFASLARHVRAVAEALGLRHPILLGHSHGGAVALRMVADEPGWASGLVLLCPAHPFSRKEDALVRFYLSPLGRIFARSIPKLPAWLHRAAFQRMPGRRMHMGEAEIAPYLRSLRRPGLITDMLALLASWQADMRCLQSDLEQGGLRIRTLLVWGEKDIVVPPATAAKLLEHLPDAQLVLLEGVGHLPNLEASAECGRVIRAWLAAASAGR